MSNRTDEELNRIIAEWCGWKGITPWEHDAYPCQIRCPSYSTDLNAMHEAEKKLTVEQNCKYSSKLNRMTNFNDHRATARQRSEAFVAVIEKCKPVSVTASA